MKESFWFRHDYNARNDEKILELRAAFGNEGYGIYWMLIESMAESSDGYLSRGAVAGLAVGLSMAKTRLEEVVDLCIRLGLFYEEKDKFYSPRILQHKAERAAYSAAGRKGALAKISQKFSQAQAPLKPPSSEQSRAEQKREEKKTYDGVRHETTSLLEFIDGLCQQYGVKNRVNPRGLDIHVERHLSTGIHLRPEVRKCLTWLIDHKKQDLTTQRLANWFEKAREIQKREQNKLMEPKEKLGHNNDQSFSIDPELRAKLLSHNASSAM